MSLSAVLAMPRWELTYWMAYFEIENEEHRRRAMDARAEAGMQARKGHRK